MDEKKRRRFKVELDHDVSENAEKWTNLLGVDLESGEIDPSINQYLNDQIAQRLEELKRQSEQAEPDEQTEEENLEK